MTMREFMVHLILNGELDDELVIEAKVTGNKENTFMDMDPTHVIHTDDGITFVDCVEHEEKE